MAVTSRARGKPEPGTWTCHVCDKEGQTKDGKPPPGWCASAIKRVLVPCSDPSKQLPPLVDLCTNCVSAILVALARRISPKA